jgi:hypothetical protein
MKKRMRMGWMVSMTVLAMVSFTAFNAYADTITTNQVVIKVNDVETTYDFDEVKLEVENGITKVCLCKCLCFRALQMLATQFSDGVIPRDDIKVYTGWTTDGPEELFVETMGWTHEDLAFMTGATDAAHLTIEDAYFFFVQKSTGKAWKVAAKEGLYPAGFFTYRTLVKTATATSEQTVLFQKALRPQAVANMGGLPLIDRFDIQEVAFFGQDGVLRIPSVILSGGAAYEAELNHTGNYVFELTKADSLN